MNFFDHKGLGNHLLQLCPKVVKHPVYVPVPLCFKGIIHTLADPQQAFILKQFAVYDICDWN